MEQIKLQSLLNYNLSIEIQLILVARDAFVVMEWHVVLGQNRGQMNELLLST